MPKYISPKIITPTDKKSILKPPYVRGSWSFSLLLCLGIPYIVGSLPLLLAVVPPYTLGANITLLRGGLGLGLPFRLFK
jgi:hypothetical protein